MKKTNRKIRNPLIKRVPRELAGDRRKYLIVSLFLILVIGFVSGMYVANESMMTAIKDGGEKYKLEDGHFELTEKADEGLLSAIRSGKKADVKAYYTEKARAELDGRFEEEFKEKFTKEFDGRFAKEFEASFAAQLRDAIVTQMQTQMPAQAQAQTTDEAAGVRPFADGARTGKAKRRISGGVRQRVRGRRMPPPTAKRTGRRTLRRGRAFLPKSTKNTRTPRKSTS